LGRADSREETARLQPHDRGTKRQLVEDSQRRGRPDLVNGLRNAKEKHEHEEWPLTPHEGNLKREVNIRATPASARTNESTGG
jgi:hypothetical protein